MNLKSSGRHTVICSSAIEEIDDILILIDQGGELGGVLALRNELIDSHVRLLAMAVVTLATLAAFAALTTMMVVVILIERYDVFSHFVSPVGGRV